MKILIRGRSSKHWKVANSTRPDVEAELQDMLHETPSLVPLEEIREGASPLVVAIKEFGLPGSGNTDLLAFSARGDIAIIECKLATNPESKRKVIGQVRCWGTRLICADLNIERLMRGAKGMGKRQVMVCIPHHQEEDEIDFWSSKEMCIRTVRISSYW